MLICLSNPLVGRSLKGQPKDHRLVREREEAEMMKILSDLIIISMRLSCETGMNPY
jgi:hypothetical protein